MSDQNINQSYVLLKIIRRVEKLGRAIEHMTVVTYHYKRMALAYRQMALQCTELAEALEQIDVAAFQVQQDYTLVRAALSEEEVLRIL